MRPHQAVGVPTGQPPSARLPERLPARPSLLIGLPPRRPRCCPQTLWRWIWWGTGEQAARAPAGESGEAGRLGGPGWEPQRSSPSPSPTCDSNTRGPPSSACPLWASPLRSSPVKCLLGPESFWHRTATLSPLWDYRLKLSSNTQESGTKTLCYKFCATTFGP